jgi:hypothetical protein
MIAAEVNKVGIPGAFVALRSEPPRFQKCPVPGTVLRLLAQMPNNYSMTACHGLVMGSCGDSSSQGVDSVPCRPGTLVGLASVAERVTL